MLFVYYIYARYTSNHLAFYSCIIRISGLKILAYIQVYLNKLNLIVLTTIRA